MNTHTNTNTNVPICLKDVPISSCNFWNILEINTGSEGPYLIDFRSTLESSKNHPQKNATCLETLIKHFGIIQTNKTPTKQTRNSCGGSVALQNENTHTHTHKCSHMFQRCSHMFVYCLNYLEINTWSEGPYLIDFWSTLERSKNHLKSITICPETWINHFDTI